MKKAPVFALAMLMIAAPGVAPARGALLGDASVCQLGDGPAIRANISGLKDRTGELKLELYPANQADFLKDDRDLIREGKFFRRVRVPTPQTGEISLCIKAPHPGRYALLFTHNRDGKNKFDIWTDGAGLPSNAPLGRAKPKLAQAIIDVPDGVATTNITAQYLHGIIPSFGPIKSSD